MFEFRLGCRFAPSFYPVFPLTLSFYFIYLARLLPPPLSFSLSCRSPPT